ncbi:hypothetical protein Glove_99g232 [Diversispora epigaea]|uniref:Uncharacterized protein n=1 Tax=Diversispora epigaea TaxID=1348612 RepID=A0A397JAM1_9GLOM|nr:hypothetical protein Glove_99g232 [Diversispora epigaea]
MSKSSILNNSGTITTTTARASTTGIPKKNLKENNNGNLKPQPIKGRNSPPRSRGPKSPYPRRTREAKIRIRNYEEQQEQRRQKRQQTLPILQRFIPSTPFTRLLHRRNRPLTVAGPSITQPIVHPTPRARGEPV